MSTVLSPNMHAGRRSGIRLVVIHTMESDETSAVAEAVGNFFSRPSTKASAHVGVDTDSECRYVLDGNTAWAAPGANADGLHLELAGRAKQTSGNWSDPASLAILELAARRTAIWCKTYSIPAILLTDEQLAKGMKGVVGHDAVTRVYKQSSHWDPGHQFPWLLFMMRVRSAMYYQRAPLVKPVAYPPAAFIKLKADGIFGARTKARLQQWAGSKVDSVLTKADWMCIQKAFGATADGDPGPKTWKRIQMFVSVTQDGNPGPVTIRALQVYLNKAHRVK